MNRAVVWTLRLRFRMTSKTALQIFNVHLGTSFFERRYQGHRLLEVIGADANTPPPENHSW